MSNGNNGAAFYSRNPMAIEGHASKTEEDAVVASFLQEEPYAIEVTAC